MSSIADWLDSYDAYLTGRGFSGGRHAEAAAYVRELEDELDWANRLKESWKIQYKELLGEQTTRRGKGRWDGAAL